MMLELLNAKAEKKTDLNKDITFDYEGKII